MFQRKVGSLPEWVRETQSFQDFLGISDDFSGMFFFCRTGDSAGPGKMIFSSYEAPGKKNSSSNPVDGMDLMEVGAKPHV